MERKELKEKAKLLPELPGSYQFKDTKGVVLYVGKAKNLKKRVSSYFTGSHDAKTSLLLMQVEDFEYIVTESELDALLLELNLIKKYNPRYNIMLTDDKTYPYIEITSEPHPKIIISRQYKNRSNQRFGPYPNVKAARDTVRILNKIFPLRKCQTLPKEPCLYYHMGQCLAPCIKEITRTDYEPIEKQIRAFLRGDIDDTVKQLTQLMNKASEHLEFERANEYKKLIEAIKTTTNQQKINLDDYIDRDIVGYHVENNLIAIEIFFVRNGRITARSHKVFETYDEPLISLENYLAQFYQKHPLPKELLLPLNLDSNVLHELLKTKILHPKRGGKAHLVKLANLNAQEHLKEQIHLIKRTKQRTTEAVKALGELLQIPTPYRIEAFDNSNLFGEHAVSAMVVFLDGKPAKREYRKFKIQYTGKTNSDIDMMKEVLYRRYYRMLMEDLPKPDLIILDGATQQMSAAKEILQSLNLDIPYAGLVKNNRHKTNHLLLPTSKTIKIDETSNIFHLLTRIQDEAHRFVVTYHRNVRSKSLFHSMLDDLPTIGVKTKLKLLQKYKTTREISRATKQELRSLGLRENQINILIAALKIDGDEHE